MRGKCYPEDFVIEAVKLVADEGHSVPRVETRLHITTHCLYSSIKIRL